MAGGFMVSQGSQLGSLSPAASASNGPSKPFARVREIAREIPARLRGQLRSSIGRCRGRARRPRLRARAKFHVHAAQSFFSDPRRRAAPAGMNRGDGLVLCVGKQDGNAIGGLHDEKDARLARDERVALRRLLPLGARPRRLPDAQYRNESGAGDDAHFFGAERRKNFRGSRSHVRANPNP